MLIYSFIAPVSEDITLYEDTALLISVPVDPAIRLIKNTLEQDGELHNRISMTV